MEEIFNEKAGNMIPPVFIFQKVTSSNSRKRARFLGLAVPEDYHLGKDESLKAIWRTSDEKGFNYRVAA